MATSELLRGNLLNWLIAYEEGELDEDEVVELFQHLTDLGLAWHLQGSYGRTAQALIEAGLVIDPRE